MAKLNNPNIGKIGRHWKPGESGNPEGKPKGTFNRSTIAKRVLQMNCELPEEAYQKIKAIYPDIEKRMSAEEMATIVQITNAISKGDTQAYKAVMDSAYGAPTQEIQHEVTEMLGIMNLDPLSIDETDDSIKEDI